MNDSWASKLEKTRLLIEVKRQRAGHRLGLAQGPGA